QVVAAGVGLPHGGLGELADAGLGHLGDERPALGQLPAGHALGQEAAQLVGTHGSVLGQHDGGQRPLAPFVVGYSDDGGLADVRVGHQRVLQLHGGDPLAAGLDHVLGPVGQGDVAEGVYGADIAGAQPAVVELAGIVVLVVAAGDPGAADLDLADGYAVIGQHGALVADEAALDLAHEAALGVAVAPGLVVGQPGGRVGDAAQGGGLGHAPGLDDGHAELLLVGLDQGVRHGRPAAGHQAQRGQVAAVGPNVLEQAVPDGGHGARQRGPLGLDHGGQRRGLEEPVGHEQLGSGHDGGVGQAPGVGVEHGHHGQHLVPVGQAEHVPHGDGHGMQVHGTVAVNDALGVAGGAAGVAHGGGRPLVHLGPVEVVGLAGQKLLVGVHVPAARFELGYELGRVRYRFWAAHHDVSDGRSMRQHAGQQGQQSGVDDDDLIPGVFGDVADDHGVQAQVQGM